MMILGAVGNRLWGSDYFTDRGVPKIVSKIVGILLMTFSHSFCPLVAYPFIAGTLFFWRVWPSKPWLHILQGLEQWPAYVRSLAIIPYVGVLYYFDPVMWHLIAGVATIPLTALFYQLSGKQKKTEPVALAECLVGALIGVI